MTDLTFATTDDIMDELRKRYDVVVLTTLKRMSDDDEERRLDWRGSSIGALGLCRYAADRISGRLDGLTVSDDP